MHTAHSTRVDWDSVRAQFPGLADRVFLDAACVSLLPQSAGKAVQDFCAELVRPRARNATAHHLWMDEQKAAAVPQLATLLGVDAQRLALVESTSHGLNIAAQSIPWREGDEVLMCDLEFLQVAIPFVQLAGRHGVRPVFLRHRAGVVDAASFAAAMSPRTRAVVLSSTQWSNGYRIDLTAVAEACRRVGAWLVVDAIQQAGAVPVETEGVDFLVAGGHKWLNAPMGTGFMCVSARVLDTLEPASWGYLSLAPPKGGWNNYFTTPSITPDRQYEFTRSAQRFEVGGTANYPGAIALAGSVRLLNGIGAREAAERVWALGDRLIEGLRRLDVRLETPFGREHRAGIISFTCGSRERDTACHAYLLAQDVCVAQRYTSHTGGIRASVHYFNDAGDIDRLLASVAEFLRTRH
ncbi:MAG: aminotransferase class V-fold PLP-dependent enzyme [Steroidobacteraceae bacterium]